MDSDLNMFGRRLERHIVSERTTDECFGTETTDEHIKEVSLSFDGTLDDKENLTVRILGCGHPHRVGEYMARCDECSKKAKHPVYVCDQCGIVCPVTGQALCLRCTKLGPDGKRYSPQGYKAAKRMGLFVPVPVTPVAPASPPSAIPSGSAISTPVCVLIRRPGLLARLLEWW